jgi:hypothetical protein
MESPSSQVETGYSLILTHLVLENQWIETPSEMSKAAVGLVGESDAKTDETECAEIEYSRTSQLLPYEVMRGGAGAGNSHSPLSLLHPHGLQLR